MIGLLTLYPGFLMLLLEGEVFSGYSNWFRVYEKIMRVQVRCHFDALLCDVFIERQKQPRIYITGVQNENTNSQQIHHGLYRSQ